MDFGLWTTEEGTVLLNPIYAGVRVCGVADIYILVHTGIYIFDIWS